MLKKTRVPSIKIIEVARNIIINLFSLFIAYVIDALGWVVIPFVSWDVIMWILPLSNLSESGSMVAEILFSGGCYFLMTLVLLTGTKFNSRLNNSMILLQTLTCALAILKVFLVIFGVENLGVGIFYFHNFEADGRLWLAGVQLVRGVSLFMGIMFFLKIYICKYK